jgi:hypothetical protein
VLHSGLEAAAVALVPLVAAFVPLAAEFVPLAAAFVLVVAFDVVSLIALLVVWASAGVAARTAAAIRLRVKLGFMKYSSGEKQKTEDMLTWDTRRFPVLRRNARFRHGPTGLWTLRHTP